jgi:hypothetical protein
MSLLLDTCLFLLINQTFAFMAMGNVFLISDSCYLGEFSFFFYKRVARTRDFFRGRGILLPVKLHVRWPLSEINGITCYSI